MRRPVPTLARCAPTITRESRYWARVFRGLLTVDDLRQEATIVALKVLDHYDPQRAAAVETLLTLALRRHFRRLIKRTLTRAFLYDAARRSLLVHELRARANVSPEDQAFARTLVARIPPEDHTLAAALMDANGNVAAVARQQHWTLHYTNKRVAALRARILR